MNPHDAVRHARRYIDRHYDSPITIAQLSREAALSPFHFIRLFSRIYKQTPHQYLIQRRIAAAKDLLRTSDLPITEICVAVGFESLGSFSTLFRRVAGLSPRAYRLSGRAASNPAYIPLCVCYLHGLDDAPDRAKSAIFEKQD